MESTDQPFNLQKVKINIYNGRTREPLTRDLGNFFQGFSPLKQEENTLEKWVALSQTDEFVNWVDEQLEQHGVIVFRGLPIKTPQDFCALMESLKGWKFDMMQMGGGGPRVNVAGPVFTSTESPPEFNIPLHHELAYLNNWPKTLVFHSELPAKERGETPVCDSASIVKAVQASKPEFFEQLKSQGVRYVRVSESRKEEMDKYQRCWQDVFHTEDWQIAEQRAYETGTEKVEWNEDHTVLKLTSLKMDAFRQQGGQLMWFNAIVLLHPAAHGQTEVPWTVLYGDYSEIDAEDVLFGLQTLEENSVAFKWESSDFMMVNNFQALHARNDFIPPRKTYAVMRV